jgi:hypothetical protein
MTSVSQHHKVSFQNLTNLLLDLDFLLSSTVCGLYAATETVVIWSVFSFGTAALIDLKLVGFRSSSVKIANGPAATDDQVYCAIILFGNITDRLVVILKGCTVEVWLTRNTLQYIE